MIYRVRQCRSGFPLTHTLSSLKLLCSNPFTLIDIGCSKGIESYWRSLGDAFRAYCVDVDEMEILRLREMETHPYIKYYCKPIGLPREHPMVISRSGRGPLSNNPWSRLSTAWGAEIISPASVAGTAGTSNLPLPISISDFAMKEGVDDIDFIKIDIDGDDYCALLSCDDLIARHDILGFHLEVNFFGSIDETDNTFHNTDRFMRSRGYQLFDLSTRRYSRRDLPSPFVIRGLSPTRWGAVVQGDALYVKDKAVEVDATATAPNKILKLAAVFEIFGLADCAAEILNLHRNRLSSIVDIDNLLNLLTPLLNGKKVSYQEYLSEFSKDVSAFNRKPLDMFTDKAYSLIKCIITGIANRYSSRLY